MKKKGMQWGVSDMLNYALQKYSVNTETNEYTGYSMVESYKRDIRRRLVSCGLVTKTEDEKNYSYKLPCEIAKTFIDETMKDYFSDSMRFDESDAKARCSEADEKLNKERFEDFVEEQDYLAECYSNGAEPYADESIVTKDEIEKSILNMMIRAIFNQYYDFAEKQYIKDYTKLKSFINSEDIRETYANGYSYLKNKIDNPIENYCIIKK